MSLHLQQKAQKIIRDMPTSFKLGSKLRESLTPYRKELELNQQVKTCTMRKWNKDKW